MKHAIILLAALALSLVAGSEVMRLLVQMMQ